MAYAVRRPVENVYLVRERDRRRTRELVALVPGGRAAGDRSLSSRSGRTSRRFGSDTSSPRSRRMRETLLERRHLLEMDRAQAVALRAWSDIARGTLGLVPPTLDQVILVKDSALASSPAPAPRTARPRTPPPGKETP